MPGARPPIASRLGMAASACLLNCRVMNADRQRRDDMQRFAAARLGRTAVEMAPASADASFRSYWRVRHGARTFIVMDAPPGAEDVRPWLDIGARLRGAGLHAPEVFASDVERGFVLMEDLGTRAYLPELNDASADALYSAACDALLRIQTAVASNELPVFDATRTGVEALYAFDYKHADASVNGKLAVLTGDLRDQYKTDLSQGGIIDTYKQVSATTSYEVLDVGLQQINDAQDTATVVVFGQYVVKSVNSGTQPAPQGSECSTTSDGAQSCTQTVQVHEVKVGGSWKISDLTLLTTT